jgi:hypothetical protein
MAKAFFVVRAVVSDPSRRSAFDDWYRHEHLPQAMAAFGAEKGWRVWSETDPAVHQATYRFADLGALNRGVGGDGLKALVAEFDRAWPGVPRTREIMTLAEEADRQTGAQSA